MVLLAEMHGLLYLGLVKCRAEGRDHKLVLVITAAMHDADDASAEASHGSVNAQKVHVQLLAVAPYYDRNVAVVNGIYRFFVAWMGASHGAVDLDVHRLAEEAPHQGLSFFKGHGSRP